MTDLTVKLRYRHELAEALNMAVRLSFPIWGIAAPAVLFIGLLLIAGMVTVTAAMGIPKITFAIPMTLGALAVTALGYRLNKSIEKQHLLVEKNGIELPKGIATFLSSRYVPWSSIAKIEALDPGHSHPRLAFFTRGAGTRMIECSRLSSGELEQLLLAIQLWAPAEAKDPSVALLQDTVKPQSALEDKLNLGPSYTALWEDELHRRFRQVAFLPLEPGATIRNGSLKVLRQLAMGGLSAIYLCQLDQRDLVIIKESATPPDVTPAVKTKAEELFDREAKILMKLSHPKVVKVLDHFVTNDRDYMMLEYVKGQDLRQYVKQNGLVRESIVLDWAKEIVSVLEYLHDRDVPIIHRDLTPDNIVVKDDGSIVVIDFGAANEFIGNSTGTFVGKQCYIAPEQFKGKAIPQSDIYAFGCTLHFLLTGMDPQALSVSHPHNMNNIVSVEIDKLVADCTAVNPAVRVANPKVLSQRLDTIILQRAKQ